MILRRYKTHRALFLFSTVFLLFFNLVNFLARRFVHPAPHSLAEGWIDGAAGACLGVAIMTLYFAFRAKHRES